MGSSYNFMVSIHSYDSLSNHPTIFAYTNIFFSLRHNQIHVQNHVVQGQPSQAIPLSIAQYKKAVYSGLRVQVGNVGCMVCAVWYSRGSFDTSTRDGFIV